MSMDRGTLTRLSMQRLSKRFTRNKDYNKVDDVNDTRVPLHNEDAFQHGLKFKAKFIGTLEIARPQSKIDIITAMRRIRYEYKVKGVKKQRCLLEVSTKGVRVSKRKRGKRRDHSEEDLLMMQHPIYRIFYVSHDSQDLKIFSYITRESSDNSFQCNVFKAYKKRLALHIVRSLGQAFDVCHKQNPKPKKKKAAKDADKKEEEGSEDIKEPNPPDSTASDPATHDKSEDTAQDKVNSDISRMTNGTPPLINFDPFAPLAPPPPAELQLMNMKLPPPEPSSYVSRPRPKPAQSTVQENPLTASNDSLGKNASDFNSAMSPTVSLGEPMNETDGGVAKTQWDVERQQISAQMTLLKEQLQSETSSRIEAQARVEHLLLQNKELLSHLQKLMVQLQQLQAFQVAQQKATTPPPAVPDSTQTPPTTEPEDTSSEVTEPKTEDTSHDLADSSPNMSHDQPPSDKAGLTDLDFDEAFKVPSDLPLTFEEDPFKPLDNDTPTDTPSHDKETLDAAFTPIATT